MGNGDYVHGYSGREERRLLDQAGSLVELLHHDTAFPAGSEVLEAGCGVGAVAAPGLHWIARRLGLHDLAPRVVPEASH